MSVACVTGSSKLPPADRNRTRFPVAEAHDTRAFVKGCDIGFEIGGERFFARNLFEAAAHFAQRLRPARSGIGKQKHVQSHLAIVFGKRDARIDGSFAGSNRHGRCIADDDRPLHKRLSGARVDEFRKVFDRFNDFARTLAASRDDDDIDFGVAARRMLDNRFTRAERTGYAISSAERNGKKRIDETYLRNHRVRRCKAFGIAVDSAFYRPLERHRNRM